MGAYGGQMRIYPIPPAVLEVKHRSWARAVFITQGASVLEDFRNPSSPGKRTITYPWPGDLVLYYQQKLIDGYGLVSAWLELSESTIVEVLDTVRNRTLNMALQIKDELGTSYADLRRIQPGDAAKIQSIVFNNIGGNTNVAFGGSVNARGQGQTVIAAGDRPVLDRVLSAAGLGREDLDGLTTAMQADGVRCS